MKRTYQKLCIICGNKYLIYTGSSKHTGGYKRQRNTMTCCKEHSRLYQDRMNFNKMVDRNLKEQIERRLQ